MIKQILDGVKKMKSLKEDLNSELLEIERWWIRIPITLFAFFVFSIPFFFVAMIYHAISDTGK